MHDSTAVYTKVNVWCAVQHVFANEQLIHELNPPTHKRISLARLDVRNGRFLRVTAIISALRRCVALSCGTVFLAVMAAPNHRQSRRSRSPPRDTSSPPSTWMNDRDRPAAVARPPSDAVAPSWWPWGQYQSFHDSPDRTSMMKVARDAADRGDVEALFTALAATQDINRDIEHIQPDPIMALHAVTAKLSAASALLDAGARAISEEDAGGMAGESELRRAMSGERLFAALIGQAGHHPAAPHGGCGSAETTEYPQTASEPEGGHDE